MQGVPGTRTCIDLNIIYTIYVHTVTTLAGVVYLSISDAICHTFTRYASAICMPSARTTQAHHTLILAT